MLLDAYNCDGKWRTSSRGNRQAACGTLWNSSFTAVFGNPDKLKQRRNLCHHHEETKTNALQLQILTVRSFEFTVEARKPRWPGSWRQWQPPPHFGRQPPVPRSRGTLLYHPFTKGFGGIDFGIIKVKNLANTSLLPGNKINAHDLSIPRTHCPTLASTKSSKWVSHRIQMPPNWCQIDVLIEFV